MLLWQNLNVCENAKRGVSERNVKGRGSVCVKHTYPAAEATVCMTVRSTEAKDNHWTIFLYAVTQRLRKKRAAHAAVLWKYSNI